MLIIISPQKFGREQSYEIYMKKNSREPRG